jgi:hypothetical protein
VYIYKYIYIQCIFPSPHLRFLQYLTNSEGELGRCCSLSQGGDLKLGRKNITLVMLLYICIHKYNVDTCIRKSLKSFIKIKTRYHYLNIFYDHFCSCELTWAMQLLCAVELDQMLPAEYHATRILVALLYTVL